MVHFEQKARKRLYDVAGNQAAVLASYSPHMQMRCDAVVKGQHASAQAQPKQSRLATAADAVLTAAATGFGFLSGKSLTAKVSPASLPFGLL